MPNSLRSKIKHLAYKGEFNERERDRLLSALDHEIDVTYICDGKKCPECSKLCNHTTDISHAKNFKPVMSIDGKTILIYEEVENERKAESEDKNGTVIDKNLCDSCITEGCIFQSGIIRSHCDFYKAESEE